MMRRAISGGIKRALFTSGHYARTLSDVAFGGLVVLCYHNIVARSVSRATLPFAPLHVDADEFAGHCRLIRDTCHPVSLDDWRAARASGRPLPPRGVLVTFDDGYRSVLTTAKAILDAHGIPCVVFACTQPIADRSLFWFDAVARRDGERAVEALKAGSWTDWRSHASAASALVGDDDPVAPLTVDDIRHLADSPLVEIGAHTTTHPILSRAPVDEQRRQIEESQQALERWTGRKVTAFAYPNGRAAIDYTADTLSVVKQLGFDVAFTTESRVATNADDELETPRFVMMSAITTSELAHRFTYHFARG